MYKVKPLPGGTAIKARPYPRLPHRGGRGRGGGGGGGEGGEGVGGGGGFVALLGPATTFRDMIERWIRNSTH